MVGEGGLHPGMYEAVLLAVAWQDLQLCLNPTGPAGGRANTQIIDEGGLGEACLYTSVDILLC